MKGDIEWLASNLQWFFLQGGARRLQQDMGSYGEYGYGSSSYGYGEPAAYGEGASIDYATEPVRSTDKLNSSSEHEVV